MDIVKNYLDNVINNIKILFIILKLKLKLHHYYTLIEQWTTEMLVIIFLKNKMQTSDIIRPF